MNKPMNGKIVKSNNNINNNPFDLTGVMVFCFTSRGESGSVFVVDYFFCTVDTLYEDFLKFS